MSTEAMKLALEALEGINSADNDRDFLGPEECCDLDNAITALQEALAQPQQEQVATAYFEKITGRIVPPGDTHQRKFPMCYRPLVFGDTSPPARKPLTDEEIETVWMSVQANDFHDCVKPFVRAIEAKHGIKGDA